MISLEYAAGFIDADGCITYYTNNAGTQVWELCAVQSVKNGTSMLDDFQERWGGCISTTKKDSPNHSDICKWSTKGVEAAIAISDIYEFLIVKKDRATQALEYFQTKPKIARILSRIKEPRR